MSEHTDGPWVESPEVSDAIIAVNGDRPLSGSEVSDYGGQVVCESVEQKNKAIIQAAPDLYEALKAVEWLESPAFDIGMCPCCGAEKEFGHAPGCLLGNALRKAEGGGE